VVAALDVVEWTRGSHKLNHANARVSVITAPDCKWIDVGLRRYRNQQMGHRLQQHHNWDLRVSAQRAVTAGVDRRLP